MYGIYANMWGILMVNVTIYSSTMDPMDHLRLRTWLMAGKLVDLVDLVGDSSHPTPKKKHNLVVPNRYKILGKL